MQHARSRPMLPPLVALGALLLALLGVECQANASRCCAIAGALGLGPGAPGGLPVVVVNTSGVELVMDGPNTRATMCTCGAPEEFDGFVEISVRGSSSAREPGKKSFSMSLLPPAAVAGNDTKSGDPDAPFMGMPAAEKWNLYGAQRDRSLGIRNFLAMAFGRAMGRNASRTAWFEMVLVQDALPLNPSHYWGLYLAMEKIERGKERVDIKKLTPKDATGTAGDVTVPEDATAVDDDVSGGYIVRFEHGKMKPGRIPFNASLPGVSPNAPPSPRALPYILEYPDLGSKKWSGDAMAQARNRVLSYIARYMGAIEAAFARGADSTMAVVAAQGGGGADWRSLVDEGAFIDVACA
ncbi:hypothetical protein FOA52_005915 [Chlamydomonas sp. UWO 241]|nr:hypothetical protein FOA52_005915 [Chlamydomonas sp. UWO 241]